VVLVLLAAPVRAQTGAVAGTVTEAETGEVLPGANILIAGTSRGTVADFEGRFVLSGLSPGDYGLLISYTGYQNVELSVQVMTGETEELSVVLDPGIELDPVQITAGRRQEKALEAPASITVVGGGEIARDAPQTSVRALRNVTGVDIVQTGVDRHEVVVRGFNNTFSGAAHVLTDYRQASAAVIGVNVHSIMPALPIDIDRVEVVRGAGAALYGPGVDAGVIHYLSRDAFSHPGVTVAAATGQRNLMNFQGRVAGVIGKKLGLKLTGAYSSANEFELEGCAADLLETSAFDQCPDPLDAQQLAIDGEREKGFNKLGLNGYAEYRFNSRTSLQVGGGLGRLNGTILSGIGTIQAKDYIATYGQVRFSSGRFFAQAYLNNNDSGDSYVYNGDPVIEFSSQANIQAQYALNIGGERQELIFGTDLEFLSPDSRGTVYGRNEDSDNIRELGAYVQSKTQITNKLDLVAAIRGDHHNQFGKIYLSPRLGLVLKPTVASSVRATYNRTVVNPGATALFLDLIAARLPVGGGNFLSVRGRGIVNGFTWNRNPAYTAIGAPTDLVASSMIPGMEGADVPVGLPTDLVYGLVYSGLAAIPDEQLADDLIVALGLNVALRPVLLSQIGVIKGLLHPSETVVEGFSPGQLGLLNISSREIDPIQNELEDLPAVKPQESQFYEVGYKGILGDRVLVALDAYYAQKKNFVGALQIKTPFVVVPTLTQDLTRDLATGIAGNDDLLTLLDLLGAVSGLQLSPEAAAALIVGLAASSLPSASTPVAIVQAAENHAGAGNPPELLVTYPNFGSISYYGVDASLQVVASDNLSLFANMSWVSDDFFDNEETGEELESAVLAMNAPARKYKLGGTYQTDVGLSVTASGRYVAGFHMISGQYVGRVDPYFLLDMGIGYEISEGLRADLNVSNLTNYLHREFIGAPKLGRIGTLRLLYTAGW